MVTRSGDIGVSATDLPRSRASRNCLLRRRWRRQLVSPVADGPHPDRCDGAGIQHPFAMTDVFAGTGR